MKKKLKSLVILPVVLFLFFVFWKFILPLAATKTVLAQASPRPSYIGTTPFPCDLTAPRTRLSDPEFHSLRPYQASPCNPNKEDLALFCGSSIFVGDYITILKLATQDKQYRNGGVPVFPNPPIDHLSDSLCQYCSSESEGLCLARPAPCIFEPICGEGCYPGSCTDLDNCGFCEIMDDGRRERCAFTISNTKRVAVDLSDAKFPIMGYTEPSEGNESTQYVVINSVNRTDENMDNPTKMNEYVSWYLNGVNGRAEYPYLNPKIDCVGDSTGKPGTCMETREDTDTGELQCLGTWGIPFITPFRQLMHVPDGKSVCTGSRNYCCVNRATLSLNEYTPGTSNIVNYSGPVKKLLPFSLQNIERISEVEDAVSSVNDDAGIRHNQVVACDWGLHVSVPILGNDLIIGGIPTKCYGSTLWDAISIDSLKNLDRLTTFSDHRPPIEENPEYLGRDFTNWMLDYKEWRGNACFSLTLRLPIIGDYTFYICIDNPFQPNIYGNLFSYIPFSSTEDRKGDVRITDARFSRSYSPFIRILYSRIISPTPADTFVPHMEEDTQLSEMLQNTFAYKDADLTSMRDSGFVPSSPYCDYANARANPGDELFAGEIGVTIDYSAQMTCTYWLWGGTQGAPLGNLCENQLRGECIYPQVDDHLYIGTDNNYGEYDCGPGRYCVTNGDWRTIMGDGACTGTYNGMPIGCFPVNFMILGEVPCANVVPTINCPLPGYFECNYSNMFCSRPANVDPPSQQCTSAVLVRINTETRTPLAEEAWARLVAGSAGIFRKMFPMIGGSSSSFEGIIDMPTFTNVTYTNLSGGIMFIGNPNGPSGGRRLYFPHIGGIKEYFLTGLQTLLRPKGYGRQPTFGSLESVPPSTFDCAALEEALADVDPSGECGICDSDLGPLAQRILTAAGEAYNVPAAAIYAIMLFEGGDWNEYRGNYTDENVCSWSTPIGIDDQSTMPRCDNSDYATQPPFGWIRGYFYAGEGTDAPWTAIQSFDPSRTTREVVNRCNFMDAAYATAKALHIGVGYIPPAAQGLTECHGYPETPVARSTSCNWSNQMMFLARQAYSGYCTESGSNDGFPANDWVIPGTIDAFNRYRC